MGEVGAAVVIDAREVAEARDPATPSERLGELFEKYREELAYTYQHDLLDALFANPGLPYEQLGRGLFVYPEKLPITLANPALPFFMLEWGHEEQAKFSRLLGVDVWNAAKDDHAKLVAMSRVVAAHEPPFANDVVKRLGRLAANPNPTGPGTGFHRAWSAIDMALGESALALLELIVTIDEQRLIADPAADPWPLAQSARIARGGMR